MIKRRIFYIVLMLYVICEVVDAQYRKELSLQVGGGLSSLQYGVGGGNQSPGLGFNMGVGYSYFFTRRFGFVTGAETVLYNAVFKHEQFRLNEWSDDGVFPFEFRSTGDVREKQSAMTMQIPIMFQYQTQLEKDYNYYGKFGLKLGIPLFGNYKIDANYTNSGYYPYEDYTYTEQRFRGFGSYSDEIDRGSLRLNPIISLPASEGNTIDLPFAAFFSTEVGLKWNIRTRKTPQFTNIIYTGLYLDYGLNSLSNAENDRFGNLIEPNYVNNQFNLTANSVFLSNVMPVSAGVKVYFTHGWGDFAERPVREKKIVIKKRTITVRQQCDCCRICLWRKKPERNCRERSWSVKKKYRFRNI